MLADFYCCQLAHMLLSSDGGVTMCPGCCMQIGVFGNQDLYYQPAFVFPKNLGPNHPKVRPAESNEGYPLKRFSLKKRT